jgi:hypothetical protein
MTILDSPLISKSFIVVIHYVNWKFLFHFHYHKLRGHEAGESYTCLTLDVTSIREGARGETTSLYR